MMKTDLGRALTGSSPVVWFGLPGLLAIGLYAPLGPGLVREWQEFPTLSHGFAIPFIAAYLVWARRDHLRATPVVPTTWGLPVLALGLATLVVGVRGEESFLARVSLPVTLFGLVWMLGGARVVRQTWMGIATRRVGGREPAARPEG